MSKKKSKTSSSFFFPDETFPFFAKKNTFSFVPEEKRSARHYARFFGVHFEPKEIEIHYATSGKCVYEINNKPYELKEGSLLVIHRKEMHRMVEIDKNNGVHKISLIFDEDILDGAVKFAPKALKYLFKCRPDFPHLINLNDSLMSDVGYLMYSILKDYKGKKALWKESVISQLIRLGFLIQRYAGQKNAGVEAGQEKDIQNVREYIDKNLAAELDVRLLAKKHDLTPNYLSYKFKKITGMNIKKYIMNGRINEAKKILERRGDRKIIDIAYDTGFKDLSHFNHVFKNVTGYTPSAYKDLIRVVV